MLVFEIGKPFQKRAGYFAESYLEVTFYRVWWLWFAVSFVKKSLYDYHEAAKNNKTVWIK